MKSSLFRVLCVVLSLLLVTSVFAACEKGDDGSGDTADAQTAETLSDDTQATEEEPTEPALPDSLELVKEYIIPSGDSSKWAQCHLIVKNVSDETLKVTAAGAAKDAEGNVLDDDDDEIKAIGPDQVSFIDMTFTNVPADAAISYQLTAEPATSYKDALANLSYDYEIKEENAGEYNRYKEVVVSVTNNGDAVAKSTEALVICFDADGNYFCSMNILGIYDDEYELKPGATESGSGRKDGSFSDFETAEVYIRAHSS